MADRHAGRQTPIFNIKANPDTFVRLISTHGVFARIMQSQKCPCVTSSGSPSMYCKLCNGDGNIYSFQRELFQPDEDSDTNYEGNTVSPWRIPITGVKKIERLLPDEQGGITEYKIESFTDTEIHLSGNNLPKQYEKMRVSYWFDRFVHVENETVEVDEANRILTTHKTKFDDGHKTSNIFDVHGDIAIVEKIWNRETGHQYKDFSLKKNKVYVKGNEPLSEGNVLMSYYYCPVTKVLPQDLSLQEEKEDRALYGNLQGMVRIAMDYWFNLSDGDLLTLFTFVLHKNEILEHRTGGDSLFEFDVHSIGDRIFDEDGNIYHQSSDFILTNFRDIRWIGREPESGKKISVKYGYFPTYTVFGDQPMPNTMENRYYPQVVNAKLWVKTLEKDIQKMPEQNFNNPNENFWS